jgi:predicted ATP-dependent Lon-type protease
MLAWKNPVGLITGRAVLVTPARSGKIGLAFFQQKVTNGKTKQRRSDEPSNQIKGLALRARFKK